jgi:hypothetical protein
MINTIRLVMVLAKKLNQPIHTKQMKTSCWLSMEDIPFEMLAKNSRITGARNESSNQKLMSLYPIAQQPRLNYC